MTQQSALSDSDSQQRQFLREDAKHKVKHNVTQCFLSSLTDSLCFPQLLYSYLVCALCTKVTLMQNFLCLVYPRRQHCSELNTVRDVCLWLILDSCTAISEVKIQTSFVTLAESFSAFWHYHNAPCNGTAVHRK